MYNEAHLLVAAVLNVAHYNPAQDTDYDLIILEGEISGLGVVTRLTENQNGEWYSVQAGACEHISVAVIVVGNGELDDEAASKIPFSADLDLDDYSCITSELILNENWGVNAGNGTGGSTIINSINLNEVPTLTTTPGSQVRSPGWYHEGLTKYFKKSAHFDGPSEANRHRLTITHDARAFGNGPTKVSIPSFQYIGYKIIVGYSSRPSFQW
ncbi:hypothetical protein EJ07DRAFT_154252 [Lizonia empirigonia]|nr:hypothetical protein EJ07DRAFT_154252 [Lizonia empirigonia]